MYLTEGDQMPRFKGKDEKQAMHRKRDVCVSVATLKRQREIKRKRQREVDPDEDQVYRPRKRVLQQTITEHFPVRKSMRQTKSTLEKEKLDSLVQKLRNKEEDGIEKFLSEGKGWGVRSTRPFKKGELVCEYSGEHITLEEAKERELSYSQNPQTGCYMYYFEYQGKKMCVDATADNNRHGRLLNHSKTNPNVVTKLLVLDSAPYLCLMAARDIKPGEELEYDYGDRSRLAIESHPWLIN